MAQESFGSRLARLRKEKGLTQNEVAEKIGVTAQAVSKWENDLASPDIDILLKLSDIFEITADELLGKEKNTVLREKPTKKEIDKMVFRISVDEGQKGDKVNVNLPLALVKIFINREDGSISLLKGNKNLENIDFLKLIELVEQGVLGELITVDEADGTRVRIFVE